TLNSAAGAVIRQVAIVDARDVTSSSTIELAGNLTQLAGNGTTTFNGTSGSGIGGNLSITTNALTLGTAPVNITGTVNLNAQDAVAVNANISAGGTIVIAANQDGTNAEGYTQSSGTSVQTTDTTAGAIGITVNAATGTGNASLALLQTGAGGTV